VKKRNGKLKRCGRTILLNVAIIKWKTWNPGDEGISSYQRIAQLVPRTPATWHIEGNTNERIFMTKMK